MKKKLLIIDDEREMRRELSVFFGRKGFEVVEAESGRDGMAKFTDFQPHVVILDIRMGNGSGAEFLVDLRKMGRTDIVVICISGYADLSMGDAFTAGADVYFPKPFNPEDLLKAASVFLGSKELQTKERHQTEQIRERLSATSEIFELGLMSAHVGHEINNRLAVICFSIEIIKRKAFLEAPSEDKPENALLLKHLDRMKRQADGIQKIVHGLQTLTYKGESSDFVTALLKTVVEDVVSVCDHRFASKSVKFESHLPAHDTKIKCHPHQISQVLVNLLNNAFDAVQLPGGELWIRLVATVHDGTLELRVFDGGPGVPEEIREKIFEPFTTTKALGSGTGLGLSLARRIMENHGGSLSLDVEGPQTCFVVRMPVQTE